MAKAKEKPGISKLIVGGFKSIAKRTEIEIRPLTVFCGANSSGKSSAMQPLLLMKQTLESPYDPGPLRLDGPSARFTSTDQFLSRCGKLTHGHDIEIGLTLIEGQQFFSVLHCLPGKAIDLKSTSISTPQDKIVTFEKDITHQQLLQQLKEFGPRGVAFSPKVKFHLVRSSFLLEPKIEFKEEPGYFYQHPYFFPVVSSRFFNVISDVIHLSGLRGNPERSYKLTASGPRFPGRFEEYTASVLHKWASPKQPHLAQVGEYLKELGLTWKVETKRMDDTQVEVSVGRLPQPAQGGAKDLVNIADVGFGVSQTLPVLVALLTADPHQLVYIEQPEIHLHPRAQFALSACVVDAAKRGVRVVLETHSSQLLLGIQTALAEGKIDPKLAIFHWFQRDMQTGESKITAVEPDSAGRFGDWPVDFDEAVMEAQTKYLDVAETKVVES